MTKLNREFPYRYPSLPFYNSLIFSVCWQSRVGFQEWIGPSTVKTLEHYSGKWDNIILVPLGFTSDHLETLFELDIELMHDFKKKYQKVKEIKILDCEVQVFE